MTEVLAGAGAGVVVADAEHASLDLPILELVRAGQLRGVSVVIRLAGSER